MTVNRQNPFRLSLALAGVLLAPALSPAADEVAPAPGAVAPQEDAGAEANRGRKNGAARAGSARPVPVAGEAASGAEPAPAMGSEELPANVAAEASASAGEETKPRIRDLGEGDQKVYVVDHKESWSMHVENVATDTIFRLWHEAGGPEVTTKVRVDRPFTISVHKLKAELILERLFEGYGYTLHYDDDGRLASVRVYSPRESFAYKTPRLTEALSRWKEVETDPEAAARKPQ